VFDTANKYTHIHTRAQHTTAKLVAAVGAKKAQRKNDPTPVEAGTTVLIAARCEPGDVFYVDPGRLKCCCVVT
jgi:hypothetical protein